MGPRCPPVAAAAVAAAALRGTGQDGDDAPFSRVRRLARTAATASVGCLFGVLALRSGQPTGVTLCLITAAFVAGLISVYGHIASVAGMQLLLGAVIGAGIPVPGPWWRPPLALLGGSASWSMLQGAGQAWSRRWARMMSA